jgi:radical SAM protein with 4Fe4S-binding SPASM domain
MAVTHKIRTIATKTKSPPSLAGYTIDYNRAKEFRDKGKLLTMRLETSRICNLKCIYCNNDAGIRHCHEISFPAMRQTVNEVKSLGAESVVIIGGGEPLLFAHITELISHISKLGMIPVIITNGLKLTKEFCFFLRDNNASLLLKCDSLLGETQDMLCGETGAYASIMHAIDLTIQSGFNAPGSPDLKAGLSFVVTKLNAGDILALWKFCRENNFYPNFEEFIPRGRGLTNYDKLFLDKKSVFALKKDLLDFDRSRYGYDWLIHAPLPGHGCFQPICSVYITSTGDVRPCPDIEVSLSNIEDGAVAEIIETPFFLLSRNIEKHLQGNCRLCRHGYRCIGCRGNAFNVGTMQGMSPEEALCSPDPLCLERRP